MTMSIGIDYKAGTWKTCFTENGQTIELCTFGNSDATLAYIESICAVYSEPIIALSSALETTLCSMQALLEEQEHSATPADVADLHTFLVAIGSFNAKNFHLPALKSLKSIPRYRKRKRKDMGNTDKLCSVTTLLYRMRQQEASWPEMRFLYLEVGEDDRSIVVVKDGRIVDGMTVDIEAVAEEEDEDEQEQAFWEGLAEDVAGLMAIHHFEDIVVIDRRSSAQDTLKKRTVVDRLGDTYQLYLFPRSESEPAGFETAIGASLIAEGLFHPSLASEVVDHLQVR